MVRNQSWNDRAPVDFSPGQLREDEVNEDPGPSSSPPSSVYRPRAFDHKTINSIVASCVSVGLTPSDLVEVAEMKGLRVRDPSSYRKVSRWQQGHPHFSSSKWAVRKGPTVPGAVARPPSPHINGEAISHEQGRPGSRGVRNVSRSNGYHAAKSDDQNYGSVGLVDINGAALKVHLTPPHSHSHAAAAAVSPTDS